MTGVHSTPTLQHSEFPLIFFFFSIMLRKTCNGPVKDENKIIFSLINQYLLLVIRYLRHPRASINIYLGNGER